MSMQQSPNTIRHTSLVIAAAVLCAASITGCNRSTTLPPLVDEQGGPQIPGKFVWHNLVTNDGAAAREFYGGLFGWEFDVKDDGRYSVITFHGRNLGGILDASKDGKPVKRGHWLSAMSVANLDASLAAVNEAGGKQLEAPIHVSGVGSVVTVEDADGAVLHLLSSSRGDPPDVEPRVHTWLWHELLANHADRALEFYEAAFGYRAEPLKKNPGSEYRVLWSSGEARAGVIQNPFAGTRSAWIPYVRVDDPTALAERAAELGGSVVIAPAPDVREGTLALVLDPSGAPVALQKWSPQDDEDEGEVSP
ncbi:MAG: VOC family protein [Deltaproteobacteria bacterium]|nr:VOC family protein [Deltaproteobacteria bacterium]MBW2190318.1 VOC family protein [Deltaproteobacteria bacterium]MBW2404365.1 VOC family protein [Deltaproteobacteria bacterium]